MLLNHNTRVEIVRNAMALKFDKERKALGEEEGALCRRAYDHFVTPETQDAIKVLLATNQGWFRSRATVVSFGVDGETIKLVIDGRAVPLPGQGYYNDFSCASHDKGERGKLAKELLAFHHKKEDHEQRRKAAEKQLNILLKGCRTTEGLFKVWPEGKQFYSCPPLQSPVASLPAIQIVDLNKQLGLVA